MSVYIDSLMIMWLLFTKFNKIVRVLKILKKRFGGKKEKEWIISVLRTTALAQGNSSRPLKCPWGD